MSGYCSWTVFSCCLWNFTLTLVIHLKSGKWCHLHAKLDFVVCTHILKCKVGLFGCKFKITGQIAIIFETTGCFCKTQHTYHKTLPQNSKTLNISCKSKQFMQNFENSLNTYKIVFCSNTVHTPPPPLAHWCSGPLGFVCPIASPTMRTEKGHVGVRLWSYITF